MSCFQGLSRMKFSIVSACLAVGLLTAALVLFTGPTFAAEQQPSLPIDSPEIHSVEQKLIAQCNAFRAQCGLPALQPAKWLMSRARSHCAWMTRNRSMTHSAGVAENIATGQGSAESVTQTWINSPGHNANMRTGATHIGVAGYTAPDGSTWWIQQFGGPEGSPVALSGGGSGGDSSGGRRFLSVLRFRRR